jgi:hypothetical protein
VTGGRVASASPRPEEETTLIVRSRGSRFIAATNTSPGWTQALLSPESAFVADVDRPPHVRDEAGVVGQEAP